MVHEYSRKEKSTEFYGEQDFVSQPLQGFAPKAYFLLHLCHREHQVLAAE